jgi:hypothetical protein
VEVHNPNNMDRKVYEDALLRMEKLGTKSIMHPHLLEKKDVIKKSLLDYYESTEEYEKCKYINEFFLKLEKELALLNLITFFS